MSFYTILFSIHTDQTDIRLSFDQIEDWVLNQFFIGLKSKKKKVQHDLTKTYENFITKTQPHVLSITIKIILI